MLRNLSNQSLPLRRTLSDNSPSNGSPRNGSIAGGFLGRIYSNKIFYYGPLLVLYCLFTSLYIDTGLNRSLFVEQPSVRNPSSDVDPKNSNPILLKNSASEESKNFPDLGVTGDGPNKDDDQPKPRLFLHVGPQKTGSSTFQSMLDKLSGLTGKLREDNIYYRHIMPEVGDFDCELDQWGGWHNCKASKSLKALIWSARDEGADLLLTDENLDENFAQGLRDAIDTNDWDVTVIVVYRRIHEWLVSWYNQIHKTTNLDSNGKVLFDKEGIPYRTEHTHWPDEGGIHIPSFASWYQDYTRHFGSEPSQLASRHRSIEYKSVYQQLFDNVILYNLHNEGSMVTNFICDIVRAYRTCDKLQNHVFDIEKINGSIHLEHDILSVLAHEQGLIPSTLSRSEVVKEVSNYIQASNKTIPRTCNAQISQQIRTWLVDTEKIMMGTNNWTEVKETDLLALYDSFVATGKMCDVDTKAVLEDEEWCSFFRSLGDVVKGNFVLHVGPIGGNTIFETLTTLSGEGKVLQSDNYTLLEIDIHDKSWFDCTDNRCMASPTFKSLLSSMSGKGKNLLISNDDLEERFIDGLKDAIDEREWNVKIVVGYVRLNQLLLTLYEQEYMQDDIDSKDQEKLSKWPSEGGKPIPSFNAWFIAFTENISDQKELEQLDLNLRDKYVSSFDDVDFYAYHQRKELVSNFVCHIIPKASKSCKAAKALDDDDSIVRGPTLLSDNTAESDILAVRAFEKGLIPKDASRTTVRNSIKAKLTSSSTTLSRICDSQVTKRLYDWMIESERNMLGDSFTSKRIAWINQDFQYVLESGKLCALDIEKELQKQQWVEFFRESSSAASLEEK